MDFLKKYWSGALLIIVATLIIGLSATSDNCGICVMGDMFKGAETAKTEPKSISKWATTDIQGNEYKCSDNAGKVSVIVYWATWCPPCRKEFPVLVDLRNEFSKQDVEIVGISMDTPGKDLKPFVEEHGLNYTIAKNSDTLEAAFGPVKYIPTIFILDTEGKIVHQHTGNVSQEMLKSQIVSLIPNKRV